MKAHCIICGIELGKEKLDYCCANAEVEGIALVRPEGMKDPQHWFAPTKEPTVFYGRSVTDMLKEIEK